MNEKPNILRVVTVWRQPPDDSLQRGFLGVCVGRVCAHEIDAAGIRDFVDQEYLERLDLPNRLSLRLDQSGSLMRLPEARTATGLSGSGVLLAVIDTGLDWTHPDFLDEKRRTRVSWLLDQTLPGQGRYPELEAIGGGWVLAAADLQAFLDQGTGLAQDASADTIGHGTHVAGIAASGSALYPGVAPGVRLVAIKSVSSGQGGVEEDRVLRALAFAKAICIAENRPLVINLSLGNQMGAHDGTEPIELALDELATPREGTPPIVAVVAAGNDASRDLHVRSAVAKNRPLRIRLLVPATDPPAPDRSASILLDFWSEGPAPCSARVLTPSGHWTPSVSVVDAPVVDDRSRDGVIRLSAQVTGPSPGVLQRTSVTLAQEGDLNLSRGVWTVEFSGNSQRIDGWIGEIDLGTELSPRFLDAIDPLDTVGPPATAHNVVAVGAFISRSLWTDAEGQSQTLQGMTGEVAPYSSLGPTRDGRLKPELVAPGMMIASSLSARADPRSPQSIFYSGGSWRLVMTDKRHAISSGTSMAAPQVAGLAALALEANPRLSGIQVRDMLTTTNTQDAQTGGGSLFEPRWGFGKADALRLLRVALGATGTNLDVEQSLCGVAQPWLAPDSSASMLVAAVLRDNEGIPLGSDQPVEFVSNNARFLGPVIDRDNGVYFQLLQGGAPRGSSSTITCKVAEKILSAHPQVLNVPSSSEMKGDGVVGNAGQCQSSGPFHGVAGALLLILWMLRRSTSSKLGKTIDQ